MDQRGSLNAKHQLNFPKGTRKQKESGNNTYTRAQYANGGADGASTHSHTGQERRASDTWGQTAGSVCTAQRPEGNRPRQAGQGGTGPSAA